MVLQECDVDRSSNGAHENLRIRRELLIGIQATGYADYYLFFSKYVGFPLDGH